MAVFWGGKQFLQELLIHLECGGYDILGEDSQLQRAVLLQEGRQNAVVNIKNGLRAHLVLEQHREILENPVAELVATPFGCGTNPREVDVLQVNQMAFFGIEETNQERTLCRPEFALKAR